MSHIMHLGNDVVDRADARFAGKSRDTRFMKRVFSPREQEAILGAPDPDLALWLRWAGKEAAFKSASKALGAPPVFHHPEFRVLELVDRWSREEGDVHLGSVRYHELSFSLAIFLSEDAIHAVSWAPGGDGEGAQGAASDISHLPFPPIQAGTATLNEGGEGWRETLRGRLTEREWGCVSHRGSALTRLAAKEALIRALEGEAEGHGAEPHQPLTASLEIGCGPGLPGRRIPKVLLNGAEADLELTLSHHGRFQAWAFRIPPPHRPQGR